MAPRERRPSTRVEGCESARGRCAIDIARRWISKSIDIDHRSIFSRTTHSSRASRDVTHRAAFDDMASSAIPTPRRAGDAGDARDGNDAPRPSAARTRTKGSGRGTKNTHASGGRFGGRGAARGGGGDGDGDGGAGETAMDVPDLSSSSVRKLVPRRAAKGHMAPAKDAQWWRALDDEACDPITLEPLRELPYAPFEIDGARRERGDKSDLNGHLFDGVVLAEYVTASKSFENPLTREALDAGQCRALDAYLSRWKLKKFSVEKAYNAAVKEKREATANAERRSAEQAQNMLHEREELRSTLAQTMFSSLRERAAHSAERHGGRGGGGSDRQRRREEHASGSGGGTGEVRRSTSVSEALAELQADGRFALVDDDVAMLRDVSLVDGRGVDARGPRPRDDMGMASWGGWSRPSHMENSGESFPELPGAARTSGNGNWVAPVPVPDTPRGEAFPSLATTSSGRATPSWGTFGKTGALDKKSVKERIQAIPVKKSSAANIFASKVSTMSNKSAAEPSSKAAVDSEEDPARVRKNKLAEAFGVARPDERPSMFAESSAAAFTHDQLVLARKHPDLVTRLESTLEDIVTGKTKRRISMEPMSRDMRELCHVVAELYGITSASFGNEPNRHIDFFAGAKNGALPSLRLSDAMLVDLDTAPTKGSLASKTRPDEAKEYFEGYTKHFSNGEYETLAMRFSDISVGVEGVKSALREFSGNYVLEEIDDDHVVAHFWKHGTLLQASGKLGGGMRGKFRVKIVERKCAGKDVVTESKESETKASTSARLFRAATSRTNAPASAPKQGQDAINAAMDMFGF